MALVNLPDLRIRVRHVDIDVPGQSGRSEWTGDRDFTGLPGAELWYVRAAFLDAATERAVRKLRAFLVSLKGRQNWFRVPLAPNQHPGPNPTVAALVSGNSITLSSAAGLEAGMPVTFITGTKSRLVILKGNPVGETITFEPELRVNPAVASAVEIMNPYVEVVLVERRNGWDDVDGVATLELSAEER